MCMEPLSTGAWNDLSTRWMEARCTPCLRLKVEGLNSVGIGSLLTSHWTVRQDLLRVEWRLGVPAAPLWCCCDL